MGKNIGKNVSKNLNGKYIKKLLHHAKKPATDALNTEQFRRSNSKSNTRKWWFH